MLSEEATQTPRRHLTTKAEGQSIGPDRCPAQLGWRRGAKCAICTYSDDSLDGRSVPSDLAGAAQLRASGNLS